MSLGGLKIICPECNGKGYLPKQGMNQYPPCKVCNGTGLVKPDRNLEKENFKLRETRKIFREGLR